MAARRSVRRAVMATRAPRRTSGATSASPIPLLAPVSHTRAPSRDMRQPVQHKGHKATLSDSHIRDQRQMIRRHERQARARELDADDLQLSRVVDVIEVQHRKQAGIRPRAACAGDNPAGRRYSVSRSGAPSPSPRIHSLKSPSTIFGPVTWRSDDNRRQPLRLMPALEDRRAEVDVVEVQRAALGGDVHALHAALSQVFHERSCSTCWAIGSRLSTALPN